MNDDSLKQYLKENARPVTPEPLGEAARIWQSIDKKRHRRLWWSLAPAFATAAVFAFVMHTQTVQNEAKVEEEYLYQEWSAMMSDVNSDVDSELFMTTGK